MAYSEAHTLTGSNNLKLLLVKQLREHGAYHPTVLFSLGCLARLRQQQQEYEKAECIYQKALKLSEQADHVPVYILRMLLAGYAGLLKETGRYRAARWMRREARAYLANLSHERSTELQSQTADPVYLN